MTAPRGDKALGATPKVEAVLFDVDGTLVDSNDAHAQAWSDTFKEAGLEIGSETVLPLVGMGGDKLLPHLTGIDAESEEGKRLIERRTEIFMKVYLPAIRPFPEARELVERCRSAGLKCVIASSASDDELHGLMRVLGAEWLLGDATSSDDAERSKPDPDIVRAAVDKAGVGPASCVMIGDTQYDVEAATRASVRIIAFRCGGRGDEDLKGAIAIYDDPKDLLAKVDGSALADAMRMVGDRSRVAGESERASERQ